MPKHLLTLKDWSPEEIGEIIDKGIEVKKRRDMYTDKLAYPYQKTLVMLFEKTSTRTRVSFEAAMTQLGGHAQYLDWKTTNISRGSLRDEIKCLARYADIIMARVYDHKILEVMAENSQVPVINGLSDKYHPCQALADLMTIKEKFGKLEGIKLAYVGDGNNVCNSLILGCTKVGMAISVATPLNYAPDVEVIKFAREIGNLKSTCNPKLAVRGADVVYTDTWVSMGDEAEEKERISALILYQVDSELLEISPNALIMHCLPAHRGQEITDEVIDSKNSIVFDQAENRLHIQKAIILKLLDKI